MTKDLILKTYDDRYQAKISYFSYDKKKCAIVSISGEYRNDLELAKFIFPTFAENIDSYIIDFSNFKYYGGDKFFYWHYYLTNLYSDISIKLTKNGFPTKLTPLFPQNSVVLVYSNLCKDAIESLIKYDEVEEFYGKCFDSLDTAIDFIKSKALDEIDEVITLE